MNNHTTGTDMPTDNSDANSESLKGVQSSPSDTSTDMERGGNMYPSAELEKELKQLSGWEGEYTLGYLLRKLPWPTWVGYNADMYSGNLSDFVAQHAVDISRNDVHRTTADTPEEAAAKLAIELFKRGVLPSTKALGDD